MKSDKYLQSFIDTAEFFAPNSKKEIPNWANRTKSSNAAYRAIQKMFSEKMDYIKTNKQKQNLSKPSLVQISQTSVAQAAGKTPNALFNSVNYAKNLRNELESKNKILAAERDKILAKNYTGIHRKKKTELIRNLRTIEGKNEELSLQLVEEVLENSIKRLPLPIRQKLGLV